MAVWRSSVIALYGRVRLGTECKEILEVEVSWGGGAACTESLSWMSLGLDFGRYRFRSLPLPGRFDSGESASRSTTYPQALAVK